MHHRQGSNQKGPYDNLDQLSNQPEDEEELPDAGAEGEGENLGEDGEGATPQFPTGGSFDFNPVPVPFGRGRGRPPPSLRRGRHNLNNNNNSYGASGSVSPQGDDSTAKMFDFRHNKMPEGVAVLGEGYLEEQADKSTALVLPPKAFLNLDCKYYAVLSLLVLTCFAVKFPNSVTGGYKFINDYTITMDIKLDSLPRDR